MRDGLVDHDLVIFDVDETVTLRRSPHIPPAIVDLHLRLARRGTLVGLCTARSIGELSTYVAQVEAAAGQAGGGEPASIYLFPTCGAAGYRLRVDGGSAALERLYAVDCAAIRALAEHHQSLAAQLAAPDPAWAWTIDPPTFAFWSPDRSAYVVADREHAVSLEFRRPADAGRFADAMPRFLAERAGDAVRIVRHGPHTLHVLPDGCGKHRALAWLRQLAPDARALLVGDDLVGADVERGGDMDFYRHRDDRCTCIQVGAVAPAYPDIVHFAPPGSPASIVGRLFAPEMTLERLRERAAAHRELRAPLGALAEALFESAADRERVFELVDVALEQLPVAELAARVGHAAGLAARGEPPWQALAGLLSPALVESADRLSFAGNAPLFVTWLWRELALRPHVRLAELLAAPPRRGTWTRQPILAEEAPIYLLAAARDVIEGHRIFLVGKDAEILLPAVTAVDADLRARGLWPAATPPLRVDAHRIDANRTLAEHLVSMLTASEAAGRLPPDRVDAIVNEIDGELAARLAHVTGTRDLRQYLAGRAIRDIVSDLADVDLDRRYQELFDLVRFKVDAEKRFFAEMFGAGATADLAQVIAHYRDHPAHPTLCRLLERYVAVEGTTAITAARWRTLVVLMLDVTWSRCAEAYTDGAGFACAFAPVLAEVFAATGLARFRDQVVSFWDIGIGMGATMMLCRGLADLLGARAARFSVTTLPAPLDVPPGCTDPMPHMERALTAWCSDRVAAEEERPSTLEFCYPGRQLARVRWVDLLALLEHRPGDPVAIDPAEQRASFDRADAIRRELEGRLRGRDSELAASGVGFHDLFRWWLRADTAVGEVWDLFVNSVRIVYRDHMAARRLWILAGEVRVLLDDAIPAERAAELRRADAALCRQETIQLLHEWIDGYQLERRRERAGLAALAASPQVVARYLAAPSQAAYIELRDRLVARIEPDGSE